MNEKELIENLVYPDTMYRKQIEDLEQQLQSYKQKEEKLRELFEDEKLKELNKYYYGDSYELDVHELRKDILQILNEGE